MAYSFVIKSGDVITFEKPDGKEVKAVIINAYGKYASCVFLYHDMPEENGYQIRNMFVDLGKLQFVFFDLIKDFKFSLTEDERIGLLESIGATLGIGPTHITDACEDNYELSHEYKNPSVAAEEVKTAACVRENDELKKMLVEKDRVISENLGKLTAYEAIIDRLLRRD